MNKLKLSPVLAATVAAAVQINRDQALAGPVGTTVTYTNETSYSVTNTSYGASTKSITVPISPEIANADELLFVSGGDVSGSEGGSFTLTVDYADSTTQTIDTYSGFSPGSPANESEQFSTISDKVFTEGAIDGLTFTIINTSNGANETVPLGTVFTFEVAPEPGALSLAALGAGGLWLAARRRPCRQS